MQWQATRKTEVQLADKLQPLYTVTQCAKRDMSKSSQNIIGLQKIYS